MKNKGLWIATYLLAGMFGTAPAAALSVKGLQTEHHSGNMPVVDMTVEKGEFQTSLHSFIPNLIGPQLYRYLLQSDQFITLQGLIEDYQEKHIIKK